ncbi:undecaprenyl-diphosphatase [Erwinia papayae]|uniref:undecaprenyl-diphosphate phosphatase n=2 Tax=Erwinia TaxID=551 RepID=A0A014N2I3_9GAMM|nr:undecaprenyl-diphosphatase [Erwinia mallotivora]EXU73608.1 phosphoesterase PA-phosphatase [Erwinia mallotivora]
MLLPQAAWEKANLLLFSLINAPASPGMTMLALGNLFANWVIFLFPLLLLAQWFFGAEQGKRLALNASVSVAIALLFNLAIGLLWQHPRPFMVPVGHHFLAHSADPSFPSDHLSVAFAVSFSLLATSRWLQGGTALVLSLGIAWARIYLGVHFPLDILGSAVVALMAVYLCRRNTRLTDRVYLCLMTIYQWLFLPAIKKGIFR